MNMFKKFSYLLLFLSSLIYGPLFLFNASQLHLGYSVPLQLSQHPPRGGIVHFGKHWFMVIYMTQKSVLISVMSTMNSVILNVRYVNKSPSLWIKLKRRLWETKAEDKIWFININIDTIVAASQLHCATATYSLYTYERSGINTRQQKTGNSIHQSYSI